LLDRWESMYNLKELIVSKMDVTQLLDFIAMDFEELVELLDANFRLDDYAEALEKELS
jgi:hypothetical protein